MKQKVTINGTTLFIEFYQKKQNVNLSFRVLNSDEKIDEDLTISLLDLCKQKTVKEKDINYAIKGITDKLKTIITQQPLYEVKLCNEELFPNKTKKEVYQLLQSKRLKESEILLIRVNLGEFKDYNVKPFFFNKGRRFTKNDLEYLA
jgi:uncharacterized Fe-S cluster-containing protein